MAMSPNSMPSATIVWAICGRMPEMMQLGAHQPGGHHRLQEVLGDLGVDRGHAGDVDDRVLGAGVDQRLQQLLHDDLGARRVERADQRHGDDALPELDHRGGQLQQLLGLVGDDLLAGARVNASKVKRPRSSMARDSQMKPRRAFSSPSDSTSSYTASLRANTATAVSVGVNPWRALERESWPRRPRSSAAPSAVSSDRRMALYMSWNSLRVSASAARPRRVSLEISTHRSRMRASWPRSKSST